MFWLVVAAACVGCGVHLVGSPSARGLAITELMSVAMIAVHSTPSDPSTHDHVGSASAVRLDSAGMSHSMKMSIAFTASELVLARTALSASISESC